MKPPTRARPARRLPYTVAHLTTVDMSLMLLLRAQLVGAKEDGAAVHGISASGSWVQQINGLGVTHHALHHSTRGWSVRGDVLAAVELYRVLRRLRPTVLHTHNPKPGVYGRIVGRLARVPIVVNTVHGLYATEADPWPRRAAVYGLERVASTFSDAELVQNEEDVATMRRFRLAGSRKVELLGNGVALDRFTSDGSSRQRIRRELGIDDQTVVVGSVGRLVAEKGFPELFEAMRDVVARCAERGRTVRLVVVGPDDPDKDDALPRAMIEEAATAGVVMLGHRTDVADVLNAFDVFVLASHREGFPRSAMEAAAVGLPVVATDVRGCRQVVEPGVTGALVPVADPARLAEALVALVMDDAGRERMGIAGRRKAAAEFDERLVVSRVLATYRRVARRRGVELHPPGRR